MIPKPDEASDADGPLLRPEEQQAFAMSIGNVRHAAARGLAGAHDAHALIGFVRHLQQGVDAVLDAARRQGRRIDCRSGCSHCCHARVDATAPEIFAIAAEIDRHPAIEQAGIVARLVTHRETTDERVAAWQDRPACPFLVDDLCSIYPVRPAACRKAHSTDVARCAAHAPSIAQDLAVALGAEALIVGTARAYGDRGLEAARHELVAAVVAALRDPSMRDRWAAGESVFGQSPDEAP